MGASFSSRFCTAKAEKSASTGFDVVAEVEDRTIVLAEGPSTSGRPEYYSARCEAMMRRKGQFSDDFSLDIEFSKPHQSDVVRREVAPQSPEDEELNRENRGLLIQLREEYPSLFEHDLAGFALGSVIAEGGQGKIYEVVDKPDYLMKVFERGTSLLNLKRTWPRAILNEGVRQCILCAGMVEDGRFAFLMDRCWGDLRKLIDEAMQEKNVDGMQGTPFPYMWKGYTFHLVDFILGIARQMENLHERGVFHRDLKASNIFLLSSGIASITADQVDKVIMVADFECSIGVLGTKFWRAPELLLAQANRETIATEQWEKVDVYSYGMTCFEIVTGRIPFDGELENTQAHRQLVIEGKRPQLPSDLDEAIEDLITKCWAPNPSLRPTFSEIVYMVEMIPRRSARGSPERIHRRFEESSVDRILRRFPEESRFGDPLFPTIPRRFVERSVESSPESSPERIHGRFIERFPDRILRRFSEDSQFRLFGIGDELPPQYRLATVQEVNDNPSAVKEAMPGWEIANLANGSVDGYSYGMETRLEQRSDVGHKLARLHH